MKANIKKAVIILLKNSAASSCNQIKIVDDGENIRIFSLDKEGETRKVFYHSEFSVLDQFGLSHYIDNTEGKLNMVIY